MPVISSSQHTITKYREQKDCSHQRRFDEPVPRLFYWIKFQVESYHIEVDSSVPPKKTYWRPVTIHQQAVFKQQQIRMQAAGIF